MKQYIYKFLMLALLVITAESIHAQGFTVIGTVTEEGSTMGIPGATVVEKGTLNGTITDFDGNYSIDVANGNATLEFAYVGYETQTIDVAERALINVVLSYNLPN